MTVLFLTLAVFAIAMIAMALGVMITGRRLQGSCGGLATGSCVCKAEGVVPEDCPRKKGNDALPEKLTSIRRTQT
jgi:hypothetical protein